MSGLTRMYVTALVVVAAVNAPPVQAQFEDLGDDSAYPFMNGLVGLRHAVSTPAGSALFLHLMRDVRVRPAYERDLPRDLPDVPASPWVEISQGHDQVQAVECRLPREQQCDPEVLATERPRDRPIDPEPEDGVTGGADTDLEPSVPDNHTAAPEPVTLLLLGTGLAGVGAAARRRRSNR